MSAGPRFTCGCRSLNLASRCSRLADALLGEPALAQLAALVFRGAAPHAGFLVGREREFETLTLYRTLLADRLGGVDLVDGETGGPDREEELRIGVATRGAIAPLVGVPIVRADPSESHGFLQGVA